MKRTVLVTGASKGIGKAIACRLAKEDFLIVIHYMSDREGAEKTLESIAKHGGDSRLLRFDIADPDLCRQVIEDDIQQFGAYYGIVNNAGIVEDHAFPMLSQQDWSRVIHTNLDSFYNVIHPCIMPMISAAKGGRIITLSSISGIMGNRGQVNYSAAKAGIIGATKALAVELAKRKITVNCVAPGLIDTAMTKLPVEIKQDIINQIPLKRMGTTEEIAGLVSYLMSDIAGYVTRQVISINGGVI